MVFFFALGFAGGSGSGHVSEQERGVLDDGLIQEGLHMPMHMQAGRQAGRPS